MPIEESWLVDAVGNGIASLQDRELAIDVGANVGQWAAEFANIFSRVVAYEPDVRARDQIQPRENLTVVAAAVSSRGGKAPLYLRPDAAQNSLLERHPIGAGSCSPAPVASVIEVDTVSLDDEHPHGADIVKIDVEGAEVDVLIGCSGDGRWSRTLFIVECHDTAREVGLQLRRLCKTAKMYPHPHPGAHRGHCWIIGSPIPQGFSAGGGFPSIVYPKVGE